MCTLPYFMIICSCIIHTHTPSARDCRHTGVPRAGSAVASSSRSAKPRPDALQGASAHPHVMAMAKASQEALVPASAERLQSNRSPRINKVSLRLRPNASFSGPFMTNRLLQDVE